MKLVSTILLISCTSEITQTKESAEKVTQCTDTRDGESMEVYLKCHNIKENQHVQPD